MSYLVAKDIYKSYDREEVLKGINLEVDQGEFVTLLGASGCGKTTFLRIIAGLDAADSGSVFLDGNDITGLAPEKRQIGMFFQNYALFEHMTVEENIAYSLKLKKLPKDEISQRVEDMLKVVKLEGENKRMPDMLSGGQRQRVALARSIISTPKVLLLDEPLGALDAALRKRMQEELKELQHTLGITFINITHDQDEALIMSDRIALIEDGIIRKIGKPDEIKDEIRL
ncbi:MAG: ABC transporter ATP-binding protein [Oscillospiraceae bacterium]|nr:ABC transporter ATP-binding protein [Candidatus Limimonas coprohippi]